MPSAIRNAILKFDQVNGSLAMGTGYLGINMLEITPESLSGLPYDVQTTNNPQIPGVTINHVKPMDRQIDIKIFCDGNMRNQIMRYFVPHGIGKLTVTWNGFTGWIKYFVYPVVIQQDRVHNDLFIQLKLMCPDGYFNDMDDYGKNIAAVQPLVCFPFIFPVTQPKYICDYKLLSQKVDIINRGDAETSIKVEFSCRDFVKNPKLTLNDKEFVQINVDMVKGDIVSFNTDPNADPDTRITKNGVNVFAYINPNSTLFQVPVGKNYIEYAADDGTDNLNVYVHFMAKYVGV